MYPTAVLAVLLSQFGRLTATVAGPAVHAGAHATAYSTNFSTIDPSMWSTQTGCFSCSASKNPRTVFECTNNTGYALRPGSLNGTGAGLTIVTTRLAAAGEGCHPAAAGGTSGHISSVRPFTFGTIRVRSRYFPGGAGLVASAKGFVGLEDPGSGAITITVHGKGGAASGAPPGTDWTRTIQSSCYQHGDTHGKVFSPLGPAVNLADTFNVFEIDWRPDAVTLSVNGAVARKVTGAANVPQKPLHVRLHARSTEYHAMSEGGAFESFIEEFSFEPATDRLV